MITSVRRGTVVTLASDSSQLASLAALTEAATVINSTLNLDAVLRTIARLACQVTRGEASHVFSLDGRRGKLVLVAATGHHREALVGRTFDAKSGIPGQVVRSGEPMNVPDVYKSKHFLREIDDISSMRTRSVLAVPMIHRAEVIGVIEVEGGNCVSNLEDIGYTQGTHNVQHHIGSGCSDTYTTGASVNEEEVDL